MKVLVLTDFSDNAKNAAEFAIKSLGKETEYILANTYEEDDAHDYYEETNEYATKQKLEQEIKRLQEISEGTPIKPIASEGDPDDLARRFEKRANADMIIMGTKGESSVSRDLMGSVAVKVSKATRLPVLCIPAKAVYSGVKKIVLAIDYRDFEPENELFMPLVNLSKIYGSQIMILSVIGKGERIENSRSISEVKREVFPDIKTTWHFIPSDNPSDAIEEFCRENEANILSVISKNRGFIERIFHSSVSERLIRRANLPILVLEEE